MKQQGNLSHTWRTHQLRMDGTQLCIRIKYGTPCWNQVANGWRDKCILLQVANGWRDKYFWFTSFHNLLVPILHLGLLLRWRLYWHRLLNAVHLNQVKQMLLLCELHVSTLIRAYPSNGRMVLCFDFRSRD